MDGGSRSSFIEPLKITRTKPLQLPVTLTRYQRFQAFIRAPESALWPMGMMLVGTHIFVGVYLFSEEFLDDFENDETAPNLIKKMVIINKTSRKKFAEIRQKFSSFKG